MQFSQLASRISPSPTLALNAKAKALKAQGIEVCNLSVGEPDFSTDERISAAAVDAIRQGKTRYSVPGGAPNLRAAISKKMQQDFGLEYSNDEIVTGFGAKELLFHASLALLNSGDEVIIPTPYWVSYPSHVEIAGGVSKFVNFMIHDNSQSKIQICVDDLEAAYSSKTKMIILNSPNNPAGYMFHQNQMKELGEWLINKDCWILLDEIYEYLHYEQEHVSLLKLFPQLRDRVIYVNGLSKGFAMTGWRVGYVCAPQPLSSLLTKLQSQSSTSLPPFIEAAAIKALELGQSQFEPHRQTMQKRRQLVLSLLEKLFGFKAGEGVVPLDGAFYAFIDLRSTLSSLDKPITDIQLAESLLENYQVAMVPGSAFGVSGFLRMSYACADDTIEKGLAQLAKCLTDLGATF